MSCAACAAPLAGRTRAIGPRGEGVHADTVGREPRDRRDRERGRDGVVELAAVAQPRRHEPAGVDRDDDLLRALDVVRRDHRLAAPRRRLPIDRAKAVVGTVLAQARELAALAAAPQPAQTGFQQLRARDQVAAAVERGEVGHHAQVRRRGERAAPFDDAERRAETHVERTQRRAAAFARHDADPQRRARARRDDRARFGEIDRQARRRRLHQRDRKRRVAAVDHLIRKRVAPPEREARRRIALDRQLPAQTQRVDEREGAERGERDRAGERPRLAKREHEREVRRREQRRDAPRRDPKHATSRARGPRRGRAR